ncbi:MAG: hypothetical protein GEU28_06405 [Dehalococcoidia bacterium]|nr:hypothetical protein [Dehalococcoidia bacterium]
MNNQASRLPAVRNAQLPAQSTAAAALVTTARRGAALMAAGAITRLLLKQAGRYLLARRAAAPSTTRAVAVKHPVGVSTPGDGPLVEETLVYQRRVYRQR